MYIDHVNYPLLLSNFKQTSVLSMDFSTSQNIKLMKRCPEGIEFFHVVWQMDKLDTDKPFSATVQMHHKIIPYNITSRLYSCNMSSVHWKNWINWNHIIWRMTVCQQPTSYSLTSHTTDSGFKADVLHHPPYSPRFIGNQQFHLYCSLSHTTCKSFQVGWGGRWCITGWNSNKEFTP
jgi:hypothetical protein